MGGLKLTSGQALALTLVHGNAHIWGCPCSSAGVKAQTQGCQNQAEVPYFTQLHDIGLPRREKTWIQCPLQPREIQSRNPRLPRN